ncbi:Crp/Fnr family transcriptional regulator [Mycoplasmatota bacterium]|nr:Crp/Fnr family transcriptional regulator [Mycoplasmatota bacterium]
MLDMFIEKASDKIKNAIINEFYHADIPIILENDQNDYVYFLIAGSVDIIRYDEDGREQRIYIQDSYSLFGELELFGEMSSQFSCVTTKPSKLRKIHKKLFIEWMEEDEKFMKYVFKQLVDKLLYSSMKQLIDFKKTIKERIDEVIYRKVKENTLHSLTKKELCVLVKAPMRSVNRVLAKMKHISYKNGKFTLND